MYVRFAMVDNLSKQVEEIEALTSIYESDWQTEDEANRSYSIKIGKGERYVILYVKLPEDYPLQSPPRYQLSAPSLGNREKQVISAQLEEVYLQNIGESVIFQWVEKIRELLQNEIFPEEAVYDEELEQEDEADECLQDFVLATSSLSITSEQSQQPDIVHGDTIVDRKSVFQGHTAAVITVDQVKDVLRKLYENKKIAHATHNVYAYRIFKEDTNSYIQDCEDDGEAQAGGRVLHLLQIVDARNVLVIVTRWYGGVHLGPDRFRHINNAARQVLDKAGFIHNQQQTTKKRK